MSSNDVVPLAITRSEAAAMCGLTPQGFDVWVRKGIVPPAIRGTRRWSRVAIEAAICGEKPNSNLDPFEQWEADNARKR